MTGNQRGNRIAISSTEPLPILPIVPITPVQRKTQWRKPPFRLERETERESTGQGGERGSPPPTLFPRCPRTTSRGRPAFRARSLGLGLSWFLTLTLTFPSSFQLRSSEGGSLCLRSYFLENGCPSCTWGRMAPEMTLCSLCDVKRDVTCIASLLVGLRWCLPGRSSALAIPTILSGGFPGRRHPCASP